MAKITELTFPDGDYTIHSSGNVRLFESPDSYYVDTDNLPLKHLMGRDKLLKDSFNDVIRMINNAFAGSTLISGSDTGHQTPRASFELMLSQSNNADGTLKQDAIISAMAASGILHAPVTIHPSSSRLLQLIIGGGSDQAILLSQVWDAVVSTSPYIGTHTSVCQALLDGARRILVLPGIYNDSAFSGSVADITITVGAIVIEDAAAEKIEIIALSPTNTEWQIKSFTVDMTGADYFGNPIILSGMKINFTSNQTPATPLISINAEAIELNNLILNHDVRAGAATTSLVYLTTGHAVADVQRNYIKVMNVLEDREGTSDKVSHDFFKIPNTDVTTEIYFVNITADNFGDIYTGVKLVMNNVLSDGLSVPYVCTIELSVNADADLQDLDFGVNTDIILGGTNNVNVRNVDNVNLALATDPSFSISQSGGSTTDSVIYVYGIKTAGTFGLTGTANACLVMNVYDVELVYDGITVAQLLGQYVGNNYKWSHISGIYVNDGGNQYAHASPPVKFINSTNVKVTAITTQTSLATVGDYTNGVVRLDTCQNMIISNSEIADSHYKLLWVEDSEGIEFSNNKFYFSDDNTVFTVIYEYTWIYLLNSISINFLSNDFTMLDTVNPWANINWTQNIIGIRYDANVVKSISLQDNRIFVPIGIDMNLSFMSSRFNGVATYPSGFYDIAEKQNKVMYSNSDSEITAISIIVHYAAFTTTAAGTVRRLDILNNYGFAYLFLSAATVDSVKVVDNVVTSSTVFIASGSVTPIVKNILLSGNNTLLAMTAATIYSCGLEVGTTATNVSNVRVTNNVNPFINMSDCDITGMNISNNSMNNTSGYFTAFDYNHSLAGSRTIIGLVFNDNNAYVEEGNTQALFRIVQNRDQAVDPLKIRGVVLSGNIVVHEDTNSGDSYAFEISNNFVGAGAQIELDAEINILIDDNVVTAENNVGGNNVYLLLTNGVLWTIYWGIVHSNVCPDCGGNVASGTAVSAWNAKNHVDATWSHPNNANSDNWD